MPEPRKHMQDRNWLETVLRKIPGFRGYLEKEYRRESDALQREWLADRLQRSKRGLDAYSRELVDAGQLDAMPQLERLRARLDKLLARIRGAMQGYSGVFDLVQIREAELDQVYEADVGLMGAVEELADRIQGLENKSVQEDASLAVRELLELIDAIEQRWDSREDLLKGLK